MGRSWKSAEISAFITAIADGRSVSVYGDGEQRRDFTYVGNVVEANLLAADSPGVSGAVLNIATGRATTVNELAETIASILGRSLERDDQPERTGDVRDSWADVTLARELLGWEPRIGLEEGLRLAAEFFLQRTALA